jgi:hypothetical protein
MPMNALIIRALAYYGDNFKIDCPTGSGNPMNLFEVAREIANRLTRIFLRTRTGVVPCSAALKNSNAILIGAIICSLKYFHGDNGAGLGASHQTGWTGVVAGLIKIFGTIDPERWVGGRPPPVGLAKARA